MILRKNLNKLIGFFLPLFSLCLVMTGCKSDDEEVIFIPGEPSAIQLVESSEGVFYLQVAPISGATSYVWFLDGEEYTSTSVPQLEYTESGEYTVAGANGYGIGPQSASVTIDASGRPTSLAVEVVTGPDGVVTLKAVSTDAKGFRWFLNGELLQRGGSPTYLPLESGVYTCEAYNAYGTGQSVEVNVEIGVINLLDPRVVPDAKFRAMIAAIGGDDEFYSNVEAGQVTELNFWGTGVADLTGIRFFVNLRELRMQYCGAVKYLDIHWLKQLEVLDLYETSTLMELNIDGLSKIRELNINGSKIGSVELSNLAGSLEVLNAGFCKFESIDFTGFTKLRNVNLGSNTTLTSLTAANLPALEILQLSASGLTSLDLSGCRSLKNIVASFSSKLVSLTLPAEAPIAELKIARCGNGLLAAESLQHYRATLKTVYADEINMRGELLLKDFQKLEDAQFDKNRLTSVTVANCPNLTRLRLGENATLSTVSLGSLPKLNVFYCYQTRVAALDFSGCPQLVQAIIFNNARMASVNFSGCSILEWISMEGCEVGPRLDISSTTSLQSLACQDTNIEQIRLNREYNLSNLPFNTNIPKGAKFVYEFEE